MQELLNPMTMAVYGIDPETGLVKVTDKDKVGLYTVNGEWRSGDNFDVCTHMCRWVGGPNPAGGAFATSFRQM